MELRTIVRELELRARDPLMQAYRELHPDQRAFVLATNREKIVEGGNRSGKTWTNIVDTLLEARGLHPTIKPVLRPGQDWVGWYATVSNELFGLGGWLHFKRLLLYPGESIGQLPTRNVLAVGWLSKNPEIPNYLKLRRTDGTIAHVNIKSYEQGRAAFQSGGPHRVALDEECKADIYEECQLRILDTNGRVAISETPIVGEPWLAGLREEAESGSADVFHQRLDTRNNPSLAREALEKLEQKYRDHPELRDLRLRGIPLALEGAVYSDLIFTRDHVCEPFDVPAAWTRYRTVDYGFYNTGCLWVAVSPRGDDMVLYRDYIGREKTIAQNAAEIGLMSAGEAYAYSYVDPATLGPDASTGERVFDLLNEAGLDLTPAVKGEILAGVEKVWELLSQRGGVDGKRPRFRVFRSCTEFLRERRGYKFREVRKKGDEGDRKPVKRDDHLMDAWRYLVSMGIVPREPARAPLPPKGTLSRALIDKRRGTRKARL